MIDGNKNYFNHLGRYPEDDGLFFIGVDKKNKVCLYAAIGSDVSDYISYDVRVVLAQFILWGIIVALVVAMFYCFTMEPQWWILSAVYLVCIFCSIEGYWAVVRYFKKLKKKCREKMFKMHYEI